MLLDILNHYQVLWNETFIFFADCFWLIWTFSDKHTLIKVVGQEEEHYLTKVKADNPYLLC